MVKYVMWKGQISEISLTSSEDKEASSIGMLSGLDSCLLPRKATLFYLSESYIWNTAHYQYDVQVEIQDKSLTVYWYSLC